jgi:hypothetical protein
MNLKFYFSPLMRKNFWSIMRSMIPHQKEFILKNSEYINIYYYDQYHFNFDNNDFISFHQIANIFTDYELLNIYPTFFYIIYLNYCIISKQRVYYLIFQCFRMSYPLSCSSDPQIKILFYIFIG